MTEPTYMRVHLPGEGFWAVALGRVKKGRYKGRLKVRLSNEPLARGFHWGQVVILGEDDYTIVTPKAAVAQAQAVHTKIEAERQADVAQWHVTRKMKFQALRTSLQDLNDALRAEGHEAIDAKEALDRMEGLLEDEVQ